MSPAAKEVKQTAHLVIVPESTRCIGAHRALAIYRSKYSRPGICHLSTAASAVIPRKMKRGNVSETSAFSFIASKS
ncbi:hypothetical protein BDZ89DRAFT_1066540 [Hymenopellis radicata]|nr:hypothetical protein BDZ89DRAFT_1066540 [Hymenopellis radicata]